MHIAQLTSKLRMNTSSKDLVNIWTKMCKGRILTKRRVETGVAIATIFPGSSLLLDLEKS